MLEIYACQKYVHIINIYACQKYIHTTRNIDVCQKYIHVFQKNICLSETLNGLQKCIFMYFKKYIMHARNILMHVRNICIYFQKNKITKPGLHMFLVGVVWRYHAIYLNQIVILAHQKSLKNIQISEATVRRCFFRTSRSLKFGIFTGKLLCCSLFLLKLQPSSLLLCSSTGVFL